jgi:cellulose synthase operon protein C
MSMRRSTTIVRRRGLWLALVTTLLLGACKPSHSRAPFDPQDPRATVERLQKHLKRHPDDRDAWRDLAHVQWLHLAQTDVAVEILDRLAADDDVVARLSRMVLAEARHERPVLRTHAEALIRAAAKTAEGEPERELLVFSAEMAARKLADAHGDRPVDDERFAEFFDGLARDTLPYAVRLPLLSLRAGVARRRGEDYRAFYREQGCVQAWNVGPVFGTLGDLELERLPRDPASDTATDPAANGPVIPLACAVRLWNPTTHAGVRRMRTWLDVEEGGLELNLSSEEPMRVWVDGRLVHRTDRHDRFVASRTHLRIDEERASGRVALPPGRHLLEVAVAVPAERTWVLVRAVEGDGRPVRAHAEPGPTQGAAKLHAAKIRETPGLRSSELLPDPIYEPLQLLLAVDGALSDGDSDRAEQLVDRLARHQQFPHGHWARARFERADPSRGATVSAAREQAAIDTALELDPALDDARLRLYELMLARGDDADVLEALASMPKGRLRGMSGDLLRYRAHRSRGDEHLAEEVLARVAKRNPKSCRVLMAQRSLARERNDVKAEDRLVRSLRQCSGSLALRANLAETRGRYDEAQAAWLESLDRVPDDIRAIEALARIAMVQGDVQEAGRRLQAILQLNPLRVGAHIGLADVAAHGGDIEGARAQVGQALAKIPFSQGLREAGEALGVPDDLQHWRIDGLEALRDYRASGSEYPGVTEVLVLDRAVVRVYDDGGTRQIVHLVVHLLSKEALDRYGEMQMPGGATLLTLRTIKPDGTTLEPELIPGKDGLSLRHLEVGDVVESEFAIEQGPSGPLPGHVDISSFRFQSQDVPYHRSELLVVHPPGLEVREDRRKDPPVPVVQTIEQAGESLVTRLWRADRMPRLGVEPGHRALLDELPSVRVYTDLDVDAWLGNLARTIRGAQRSNPELRRLAHKLSRGKDSDRAKLQAMWRWVVENVEDGGDISMPATATLASRSGNRLMLLRALLREVGIANELWLARDAHGPKKLEGGHPMVESYEAAMLAVSLEHQDAPLMVMTASKVMPLGYLTPGFANTEALRVHLHASDGPAGRVELPAPPAHLADERRYKLSIELDAAGSGTVRGTLSLQGMEAVAWREGLREFDRDRIEEVFQQAELGWLRGATLSTLEVRNEKTIDKPLVLEFVAKADAMGFHQDGALVLPASPMPLNLGARWTALPRRTTGMVIPYAPVQHAEVELIVEGATFTEVPREETLRSAFGSYERRVSSGGLGKNHVVLRYQSTLRTGVIEPSDYEALAGFTREVEAAEQALVKAESR